MGQRRNHNRTRKYLKVNKNEDTIYQKMWDAAKAILMGNFIAANIFIRKEDRSVLN